MNKLHFLLKESFEIPQPVVIECDYSDDAKMHVNDFAVFCQKQLGLPTLPTIKIVAIREGGMTTGAFNTVTDEILVYGNKRALVDVLRTLAHELTHYLQRIEKRIKSSKRDWEIEGEADAQAGKLVYTYAHMDIKNKAIYEL